MRINFFKVETTKRINEQVVSDHISIVSKEDKIEILNINFILSNIILTYQILKH